MSLSELDARQLVLVRAAVAVLTASAGAFVAVAFRRVSHLWLCVLISFAAGALLSVAAFDIFPEVIHELGLAPAALAALCGYGFFFLIGRFVSHVCPACSATHAEEAHFQAVTASMIVALVLHSFMDGLAIYGGHAHGSNLGVVVLVAVAYHKFPEGLAFTLAAVGSGMGRVRAFWLAVALEASTTFAGAFAGYAGLLPTEARAIDLLLAAVGGGFVYLVFHALLSEVVKHHPKSTILAAAAGAAAMLAAGALLGSGHAH